MSQKPRESILNVCGSKHNAKRFYALLSNEKFSGDKITEAAKKATKERIKNSGIKDKKQRNKGSIVTAEYNGHQPFGS